MNALKKIAGINLLILLGYSLLARLSDSGGGHDAGLGFMVLMVVGVVLHIGINLLLCLVFFSKRDKERGRAFLLSSIIVAVIGFSACGGMASTY